MDKAAFEDFIIEIVRRIEGEPGFNVLPRRWVVERTFAWMMRWRCLVRLRAAHRRLQSHDPRRPRKPSSQAHSPLK